MEQTNKINFSFLYLQVNIASSTIRNTIDDTLWRNYEFLNKLEGNFGMNLHERFHFGDVWNGEANIKLFNWIYTEKGRDTFWCNFV